MSRRLQILVAVVLAGSWGAFIWSAHGRGHLAFLDRVQAAITDFATILRGVKPPPGYTLVGSVRLDVDDEVDHGHDDSDRRRISLYLKN